MRSQKLIMLVMMKSARPIYLTAGKIYIFSLESFTTVTRAELLCIRYRASLTRHNSLLFWRFCKLRCRILRCSHPFNNPALCIRWYSAMALVESRILCVFNTNYNNALLLIIPLSFISLLKLRKKIFIKKEKSLRQIHKKMFKKVFYLIERFHFFFDVKFLYNEAHTFRYFTLLDIFLHKNIIKFILISIKCMNYEKHLSCK